MEYVLRCLSCQKQHSSKYESQICKCGGILEVIYKERFPRVDGNLFWDYETFLPKGKYRHYQLGNTHLLKGHLEDNLFLKMELENPTKSFKDRGSVIEVAKANEYGYDEVVCASTGNMAYSITYYSKLFGLKSKVFISREANKDKIDNIMKLGNADVVKVDGDFTLAQKHAIAYSNKNESFLTGDYCYRKEGQKTIAYEIISQLPNVKYIIIPVGNATLLSGMYKALRQLYDSKCIRIMPKLIGVESTSCMPLVKAFRSKSPIEYEMPNTKADAIAVGYPTFGDQALLGIKDTDGSVIGVTDRDLEKQQKEFLKEYGIVSELAGVASIACFKKLKPRGDSVAIISGGNV